MKSKPPRASAPNPESDRLRQRSISKRLTVTLIAAIGVISVSIIAVMHVYRLQTDRAELAAKADEIYAYLDGILKQPLWDIDEHNIRVIGETISQNEMVISLIVRDSFGDVIYALVRESPTPTIKRAGKISHAGALAGYVEVSLSQRLFQESSRQLLYASLFTLVIALIVLIVTTGFLIRRFLKGPLDSLNHILDAYSAGSYDAQTVKIPYLEFQPFGRVLTKMGRKITRQLKEVRQAEEKYRNIFENAVEGIFQSTIDGRFISASPSMAKILGYASPAQLIAEVTDIGTQCYVGTEDRDAFTRQITQEGLVQRFETRMMRRDKSRFWVSLSARLVHDEGGQAHYIEGFCVDISKQKQLESQLRQAQKMEAIGTLAGGIAHDFNNILGVIIGCTEMSIEKITDGREEKLLLKKVLSAGNRAKELVKQILTFSRQEKSDIRPLYLSPIVKEALKFIRATTPATIAIDAQIDNATGATLADPPQVHRLLMNLYTNAVHSMKDHGGELSVRLSNCDLTGEASAPQVELPPGPYVLLVVKDSGHGMLPETMERMYDPFFTTKPVGEGTGLGLSVVHGIVKEHAGAIVADSQPQKGTAFSVYLPRLDKRQIKVMDALEKEIPRGTERILLVDDEGELLVTLQQMLEALGYTINATSDSLDAYERFRAAPQAVDLVLTDFTMPDLTGIDLSRKIHALNPEVPIIMCTGFSERVAEAAAKAAGVCQLLLKPVARWQLATAIRQALDDG